MLFHLQFHQGTTKLKSFQYDYRLHLLQRILRFHVYL